MPPESRIIPVILFAVCGVTVCGCKNLARNGMERPSRERLETGPSDRATPAWLPAVQQLPGKGTAVPKAASWQERPNAGSPKASAPDALGGRVVQEFGKPAKNIFIRIEPLQVSATATPIGIYTDDQGQFLTRGLRPGSSYQLIAEAVQDGRRYRAVAQTTVPHTAILLTLREVAEAAVLPPSAPPLGSDSPPVAVEPSPRRMRNGDEAFQPDQGTPQAVPPALPAPVTPSIPPPQSLHPTGPAIRPENTASGPGNPFAPPPAAIPGPPTLPNPPPPAVPPPEADKQPYSNISLIDTIGRPWKWPANRSGSALLIVFVTTDCPHCRPVIPSLQDWQRRYGQGGLEVVAVLCDELPLSARMHAAARYAQTHRLNYPVYVEAGESPGRVRDRLGVIGYPTAVVINAKGQLLWKGHPGRKQECEAAIQKAISSPF